MMKIVMMMMVDVGEQNYVEKRARKLLHCVKATGSLESCNGYYLDILLSDFFREELIGRRDQLGILMRSVSRRY